MDSYLQAPDVDLGLVVFTSAKPRVSRVSQLLTILFGSEPPYAGAKVNTDGRRTLHGKERPRSGMERAGLPASSNAPDWAMASMIVARQNRGQAMQAVG